MLLKKRTTLRLAICAGLIAGFSFNTAMAQTGSFPSKPLRWVVPYPAGGGSDFMARVVAQPMAPDVKQSVLVDNKPGGNGAIAVADVLRAPADGYTLINVDNGILVFNPALYKNLGYAPGRDLQLVTLLGRGPLILVTGPASTAKDARELIAQVRAQPGKFSFASAGAGSPQHMAMELLKKQAGLFMVHIPYRGSSPALSDLAGGQVFAAMSDYAAASGFIKAGKLRALAVTDSKRHPALPEVPTFKELGLGGVEATAMVGVAVRAGTPPAIVAALQQAVRRAVLTPEVRARYAEFGLEPVGDTPEQFQALIRSETQRWHALIKDQGIQLD